MSIHIKGHTNKRSVSFSDEYLRKIDIQNDNSLLNYELLSSHALKNLLILSRNLGTKSDSDIVQKNNIKVIETEEFLLIYKLNFIKRSRIRNEMIDIADAVLQILKEEKIKECKEK